MSTSDNGAGFNHAFAAQLAYGSTNPLPATPIRKLDASRPMSPASSVASQADEEDELTFADDKPTISHANLSFDMLLSYLPNFEVVG